MAGQQVDSWQLVVDPVRATRPSDHPETNDGGLGKVAPIDVRTTRASVAPHLSASRALADHPGLVAEVRVADDRVVRLRAPLDLPLKVHGLTVAASGSASVVLSAE